MSLPQPGPDRTAVVTGASSGIGTEIARELARRGHRVTLVARSADKLEALAEEIGHDAWALPADLSDRATRAALLGRITERGLVPDILVNNAGLSTIGPVSRVDVEAELNALEVDVVAVTDLTSRFLAGMVERGRGALLNVASTAAFQPLPGQAAYGASKAYVLSYTQSLAAELRGTGVTATALCPGPVKTGFGAAAGLSDEDFDAALPAFLFRTAEQVAKVAVDGMDKGRMVAIPGLPNRVGTVLAQLTPRSLLLPALVRAHPGLK